jgi:hypothetical protein
MKRSAALAPLSRDHQHALAAALGLRRAEPATLDKAVRAFAAFFAHEGAHHFALEEALLLPALPASDPEWSAAVARVLEDHSALRAGAAGLERAASVSAAREVGERLAAHVRFEERVLFELLEQRLAAAELDGLGRALAAAG